MESVYRLVDIECILAFHDLVQQGDLTTVFMLNVDLDAPAQWHVYANDYEDDLKEKELDDYIDAYVKSKFNESTYQKIETTRDKLRFLDGIIVKINVE